MIIYRSKESVWINTTTGVTVYIYCNLVNRNFIGTIKTPCGVPQILPFGSFSSDEEAYIKLYHMDIRDADMIFHNISKWKSNENQTLEYFQEVSYTEPVEDVLGNKLVFDKFNNEIKEGDLIDVQKAGITRVFLNKEDYDLYFKPYGKDEKVKSYFSNDLVKIEK